VPAREDEVRDVLVAIDSEAVHLSEVVSLGGLDPTRAANLDVALSGCGRT
jgi:hypothetical protein